MSGGNEFNEAALWRRWRDGEAEAGRAAAEPDALTLATYAERRLSRPGVDPETEPTVAAVEMWLVDHAEALDDIFAARSMADLPAPTVLIARAQALVAQPEGNVVPLRRSQGDWRHAVTLSGIAASMIAAVLVGFSLGTDDVVDLSGFGPNQTIVEQQALIGSPGSILVSDDEDTGI